MLRTRRSALAHLSFLASLALALSFLEDARAEQDKAGPPFADGPDEPKVAPRPKTRAWTVVNRPFTFSLSFAPGILEKGKVAEIVLTGIETPKTPDPRFGSTVPMIGAKLVAEISSPAGQLIRRYLMHPIPLTQGKYAFHFTPDEEGIHGLKIVGKLADGRSVSASLKVPVDVWPLPKELEGTGDSGGAVRRRVIRRPVTSQ